MNSNNLTQRTKEEYETPISVIPRIFPSSKQEIFAILSDNLENLKVFGVEKIGLFGSFVRNEANENSDIDLLVVLNNHSWDNFCQLLDYIESLFKQRKVDVVTKSSLDEYSGRNILREVEYASWYYRQAEPYIERIEVSLENKK